MSDIFALHYRISLQKEGDRYLLTTYCVEMKANVIDPQEIKLVPGQTPQQYLEREKQNLTAGGGIVVEIIPYKGK